MAHDAAVIHGPAWAAVTSDVGRQEMVTWQMVVEDFEVLGYVIESYKGYK